MTQPAPEAVRGRPVLETLDRAVAVLDTWFNYVGVTFTMLLMMMTVVNVGGRYIFNQPVKAYVDIMEMMMVLLVFLCLSYCHLKGGHIRFELFMTGVLKEPRRRYYWMETFHLLVGLFGFGLIAVYSFQSALNALAVGDTTLAVYIPTWPFRLGAALGSGLLSLRLLVQLAQNLTWAIAGRKQSAGATGSEVTGE